METLDDFLKSKGETQWNFELSDSNYIYIAEDLVML